MHGRVREPYGVEVSVGNGRAPEWRVVVVQPKWTMQQFLRHAMLLLGLPVDDEEGSDAKYRRAKVFSVRLRLAPVLAVQMMEDGDRVLLCVDGKEPVPYAVLGAGCDYWGQLGLDVQATDKLLMPHYVPTLCNLQIVQVACGSRHTLVLTKEGQVLSFGAAQNGRLGHGKIPQAAEPLQRAPRRIEVPGCARGTFVACGEDFSMIATQNQLFAFGRSGPALGLGGDLHDDVWSPESIQFPTQEIEIAHVDCGKSHALACTLDGASFRGGQGHVQCTDNGEPLFRTSGDMERLFIDAREKHVGILLEEGEYHRLVDAAKDVEKFQDMHLAKGCAFLGPVLATSQLTESVIVGMQDAYTGDTLDVVKSKYEAAAEWMFMCPDSSMVSRPRQISALCGVPCQSVAAGHHHSLALSKDGEVFAFGDNHEGQLGLGGGFMAATNFFTPVPLLVRSNDDLNETGAAKIACGAGHSIALGNGGRLYTWGSQDAIGREGDIFLPSEVCLEEGPLSFVKDIACGDYHTVCCTTFGHVLSFGRGRNGQLGNGRLEDESLPVMLETRLETEAPRAAVDGGVYYHRSDGTKRMMNFEQLDPRNDTSPVVTGVAAGGGAAEHTGHTIMLVSSQVDQRTTDASHQQLLQKVKKESDPRNFCVPWKKAEVERDQEAACGIM